MRTLATLGLLSALMLSLPAKAEACDPTAAFLPNINHFSSYATSSYSTGFGSNVVQSPFFDGGYGGIGSRGIGPHFHGNFVSGFGISRFRAPVTFVDAFGRVHTILR